MDCADYRINCDGDSDGDGNGIMYWVLNKRKAFWSLISRTLYCWRIELFYLRTGILLLCLRRLPPFTFSISSIGRARALISFCCFIIFKFLMFILLINWAQRYGGFGRWRNIGRTFAWSCGDRGRDLRQSARKLQNRVAMRFKKENWRHKKSSPLRARIVNLKSNNDTFGAHFTVGNNYEI